MARVLLITGGARGIGAATARLAGAEGYAVAVHYRERRDAAEDLAGEIERAGGRGIAVAADVAREDDVVRMFEEVDRRLGRLTHLVNSAGISPTPARAADLDAEVVARLMAINVTGTILCCREAVRRMSTAAGGDGGVIVNVSSMAAATGGRSGRTAYAASKGAVDSFTRGLAREVAREGIRVNALRPGMTRTDMTARLHADPAMEARVAETIAMSRLAEAEEMARPILFLLSQDASFVSGACLDASGGGFMVG